jgi:hypothetical protein
VAIIFGSKPLLRFVFIFLYFPVWRSVPESVDASLNISREPDLLSKPPQAMPVVLHYKAHVFDGSFNTLVRV